VQIHPHREQHHNNIRNTKQASSIIICKRGSRLAVIGGARCKKRVHTPREKREQTTKFKGATRNSREPRACGLHLRRRRALLVFGLGMSSSTINRTHAHTIPQGVFRYILTHPRHSERTARPESRNWIFSTRLSRVKSSKLE
jgi:hypothetical protein